jgi:flagellar basal body-associated protein FliL
MGKKDKGDGEGAKKSKLKPLLIVVACAGLGGAGYMFGGGGGGGEATGPTTTIEQLEGCVEGTDAALAEDNVVTIAKKNVNLADDHYLSISVALNLCPDVVVTKEEPFATAKAEDIIIRTLSGRDMEELSTDEGREAAHEELLEAIKEAYEEEVHEIFFVEFVMQ